MQPPRINRIATALPLIAVIAMSTTWTAAQERITPAVPFGGIVEVPNAANMPNPTKTYKAVFDVRAGSDDPSKPMEGLVAVARAVNIFVEGGSSLDKLDFVAVLHGPATPAVLGKAYYRREFGVDNPNLPIIKALADAGVETHICGQAIASHGYETDWVDNTVILDLSAISSIILYQGDGYTYVAQ